MTQKKPIKTVRKKKAAPALPPFVEGAVLNIKTVGESIGEYLYTPLQDVLVELEKRQADAALRKKVDDFFGEFKPPAPFRKPRAVMVRYIASPTIELSHFEGIQKALKLEPLLLEVSGDKFVAKNSEKYNLCRLTFVKAEDASRRIIQKIRVVNFNKAEGKPLNQIQTDWEEPLVDFHHRLLKDSGGAPEMETHDFSQWFLNSRYISGEYYLYYLALFLVHGILFENFLLDERELSFTKERVIPAFRRLAKQFGVRPLIVPIAPHTEAAAPYWSYYDEKILALLRP